MQFEYIVDGGLFLVQKFKLLYSTDEHSSLTDELRAVRGKTTLLYLKKSQIIEEIASLL